LIGRTERRRSEEKGDLQMALPTPVNGQITDAVTQANVKVLGDAPAMAMGAIYQSLAHSTGILFSFGCRRGAKKNIAPEILVCGGSQLVLPDCH
jgi:hypothetical protein